MKKILVSALLLLVLALSACSLPGMGSNTSLDTTPPVIRNLTTSEQNVFYNDSRCGPTRLAISMDVSDDSGSISTVGLQYRYRAGNNFGASLAWRNVSLPHVGNGRFAGELDVDAEAGAVLGQESGALEYQVYAVDGAGNIQTMPATTAESLSVQYCNAGIASEPASTTSAPVAPPQPGMSSNGAPIATNTASSAAGGPVATSTPADTFVGNPGLGLSINSLNASPSKIYYGQCGNNEPTGTTLQANIMPSDQFSSGAFVYHFVKNGNVVGQDYVYTLSYSGSSIFTALTSDMSNAANSYLGGADGRLAYWVNAKDTSGITTISNIAYIDVLPCSALGAAITAPTINYFTGPDTVYEGYNVELNWDVIDANCGVTLDGVTVNPRDSSSYLVPGNVAPMTLSHTLLALGGDCNNPLSSTETVNIDVPIEPVTLYAPLIESASIDKTDGVRWDGAVTVGDDQFDHMLEGYFVFSIGGLPQGLQLISATLDLGSCNSSGNVASTQPFHVVHSFNSVIANLDNCSGSFDITGYVFGAMSGNTMDFFITPSQVNPDGIADQVLYTPTLTIVYIPNP